jgi:hypothetical protein
MGVKTRQYTYLDSGESQFFNRAVEAVKTKVYETAFPQLRARELIPVSFDVNPGARSIVYGIYTEVGVAKIIANYATDLPRVDLMGEEHSAVIRSLGASYGYSVQDIRAAKLAGMDLETRKGNAAKRAILSAEDEIALKGDASYNILGLLSNPNILEYSTPNGAGGTPEWSTKTSVEIMTDLNGMVSAIVDTTLGIETPDTLILPHAQNLLISSKRMSEHDSTTVKKTFLETNGYIKNIETWHKLKGAGTGGADVAIAYNRSPDKLTLEIPQDFEQFDPQETSLDYEVPCHSRIGGVIIYYPFSVVKAQEI